MPIPKPRKDEDRDDFIARCMGNGEMVEDYPDQEQRAGVCFSQWRAKDEKMIQKIHNPLVNCEIKMSNQNKGEFEGYASVFNGIDAVLDTILPGAFHDSIKSGYKPKMFVNHDSWSIPVGDWKHLEEDSKGLLVKGVIDLNHNDGPMVYSAMKRDALDAMSIGFNIPKGGAEEKENGIREINKIDLKEISLVNFPADNAARISIVKTDIEQIESLKDAEAFLRDAGYSKSAATAFVSRIKHMIRSESDDKPDEITKHDVTNELLKIIKKL